jgi:hypothetical protein
VMYSWNKVIHRTLLWKAPNCPGISTDEPIPVALKVASYQSNNTSQLHVAHWLVPTSSPSLSVPLHVEQVESERTSLRNRMPMQPNGPILAPSISERWNVVPIVQLVCMRHEQMGLRRFEQREMWITRGVDTYGFACRRGLDMLPNLLGILVEATILLEWLEIVRDVFGFGMGQRSTTLKIVHVRQLGDNIRREYPFHSNRT